MDKIVKDIANKLKVTFERGELYTDILKRCEVAIDILISSMSKSSEESKSVCGDIPESECRSCSGLNIESKKRDTPFRKEDSIQCLQCGITYYF